MTGPRTTAARNFLAELLRVAVGIDRTQSDPVVSLRNAAGVVAPLAIGTLAGSASLGLSATIGALQTAFADRPGPYRLRLLRMLATAFAATVTSYLAMIASSSDAGSVLLVLVVAFAAGLLLSGGPSAAQTGTAATAAALVLGHIPQTPSGALQVSLLVLAGGVGQVVLAVAAWPLGRHRPERLALAGLYRELAAAARSPRGTTSGPPAGDSLSQVRATLYGLGHDYGPSVEAYRSLLDEAERLRREIVVIAASAERLADLPAPTAAVRAALSSGANVLEQVAIALERGKPLPERAGELARSAIRSAVAALEEPAVLERPTARAAAARLRAFGGQLRAAVDSTDVGASEGGRDEERHWSLHVPRVRLRDPIEVLRANVSPDSAVLRHAIRLAVLVAASDLVVRLLQYPRGYWVSLTLLVILRPDFGATVQRAVLRMAGTVLGLLLATGLVHFVPGGDWWRVALLFVFAFGMRFSGPNNYGLTALNLSGLVVVLLAIGGVPAHTTFVMRSLATLAGGVLAIAAVLAFPTWERDLLPQRLVALLAAYREYLAAVADPEADRERLQSARARCRVARTNAQASLDRVSAEPVPAPRSVELGRAVLTHSHRFVHAALAVDAVRGAVREAGGVPELDEFLAAACDALSAAEQTVGQDTAPQPVPLREEQEKLAAALAAAPERVGGASSAAVLLEASDRTTDSLDTLLAELRRQRSAARREPVMSPT